MYKLYSIIYKLLLLYSKIYYSIYLSLYSIRNYYILFIIIIYLHLLFPECTLDWC